MNIETLRNSLTNVEDRRLVDGLVTALERCYARGGPVADAADGIVIALVAGNAGRIRSEAAAARADIKLAKACRWLDRHGVHVRAPGTGC